MELMVAMALLVGNTPVTLVKELLRQEVEYVGQTGRGDPLGGDALDRFYTEDLRNLYQSVVDLQAAVGAPLIDGDPITGHQEYCQTLQRVTVEDGEETATTATVVARFMSQWCYPEAGPEVAGEVTGITFDLIKVGDEWRIDDFDHSLTGSFREWLQMILATTQGPAPTSPAP